MYASLLQISDSKSQLVRRVKDLVKNLSGARHELEVLQERSQILAELNQVKIEEDIKGGIKNLVSLQGKAINTATSLEVIAVILGGSLTFDILDRFTGGAFICVYCACLLFLFVFVFV